MVVLLLPGVRPLSTRVSSGNTANSLQEGHGLEAVDSSIIRSLS